MPDVIVSTDIDNFLKSSSAATAATAINVASLSGAAFSGPVTAPNQTVALSSSVITRGLQANEQLWNMHTVRNYFPLSVSSANGGSATLATLAGSTGTAVSGICQFKFSNMLNNQPNESGGGMAANLPLTFSHVIGVNINDGSADSITVYRFVVGPDYTSTSIVNPLCGTAPGFGYEIYYSTSLSSTAIRPFVNYISGFTYGTSVAFNINFQTIAHVILEKTSTGVVNIYGSAGGSGLSRPSSTPLVTLTGAPITGSLAFPAGVSMYMVNHPTLSAINAGGLSLIDSKVKIG